MKEQLKEIGHLIDEKTFLVLKEVIIMMLMFLLIRGNEPFKFTSAKAL